MLIPELYTSQLSVQSQTGGAAVRAWTAGQILEATVVRQALDGTVTLRVGNQEVQARTGLSLSADQPITLQVTQSGIQTVLRVLHLGGPDTPPDAALTNRAAVADPADATLAQAWRQVLPREGDVQPLLNRLTDFLQSPGSTNNRDLPPPVAQSLRTLAETIPTLEKLLTAGGLRQAVTDSGIFLEARLAAALAPGTAPAVQGDLKAGLLQLVAALRAAMPNPQPAPATGGEPTPPSAPITVARNTAVPVPSALAEPAPNPLLAPLLHQADAALAHIEQRQLASLSDTAPGTTPWVVSLPARQGAESPVLELRIEQDDHHTANGAAARTWSVWLDFEFGDLGAVRAHISLRDESVSVGLWAEHSATAGLFNQHLAELDGALHRAGLDTHGLHCETGAPLTPDPPTGPAGLLDERA